MCANRFTHLSAVLISFKVGSCSFCDLLKSVVNFLINQKLPGFADPLIRFSSLENPDVTSASVIFSYPSEHDVVEPILLKAASGTKGRPNITVKL